MGHPVETHPPVAPVPPGKRVSLPSIGQQSYSYRDGHLFVNGEKRPARPDAL